MIFCCFKSCFSQSPKRKKANNENMNNAIDYELNAKEIIFPKKKDKIKVKLRRSPNKGKFCSNYVLKNELGLYF